MTAIACLFFSLSSGEAYMQSITHENCKCRGLFSSGHDYNSEIGQSWQRRMGHLPAQSSAKQFIDKNGKGGYTFFFDKSVPSKAKDAFKRAVQKWVDLTGVAGLFPKIRFTCHFQKPVWFARVCIFSMDQPLTNHLGSPV